MQLYAAPTVRQSTALRPLEETVASLFRFVNEPLPIGRDLLEWSTVVPLAELIGGPKATALLRSRVREMELAGSRFGHVADKDVVSCDVFVRFVADTLHTSPTDAWEALQVVCGVTQLYSMALGGAASDDTVTWHQLQALFPALQATGAEDKQAAAKIWRAISPRGNGATLPQMLQGLLVARNASATDNLEKDLAAAYTAFRATHLRAAASALTARMSGDAHEATYVLNPGFDAVFLEVVYAYTGQSWLALDSIAEINPRHSGYLLKRVAGKDVGGEDPATVAAMMQTRPVKLTFVDITDGVLGDARFAALLERRKVSVSQQEEIESVALANEEAEEEESPKSTGSDDEVEHGCSKAVEALVRYMFREIEKAAKHKSSRGRKQSTIPRGSISAKLAALAVHCLNHSVRHDAVFEYVKQLHESGGGPGDPEDAGFAFAEEPWDSDPYSGDEGEQGDDEGPSAPRASDATVARRYAGTWEVLSPVICRKEPSRRSPVAAELPAGHDIEVTRGKVLPDQSIRLLCKQGWISTHSRNGVQLVSKVKDIDGEFAAEEEELTRHTRMPDEADDIPVDLETFMCLVGGAERHPGFSFTDMLKGLREVMSAGAMFKQMDMYSTGRVTIVELALLVQDLEVKLAVEQVRQLWGELIGVVDHSVREIRSIEFADLLEGMEDIRRISMDAGAITTRFFRRGVLERYGPGSHIDRLLGQFLSGGNPDSIVNTDVESHLLFKMAFDKCDRASKGKEATGYVDARIAALIIHSLVHEIDYNIALRQISGAPVTLDFVGTYKVFHDIGSDDPYTDEEEELRERDEKPSFVYEGEYVVGDEGADLYNEAGLDSGYVLNKIGEIFRLMPGEKVKVTEGRCIAPQKWHDLDGKLKSTHKVGRLMLRCAGDWLSGDSGWIDPLGEDGELCIARADGQPFSTTLESVDAEETPLQDTKRADKILVHFDALSSYMSVAKQNPRFKSKRFTWGIHEIVAAATLFRACDSRNLGRIALIDLALPCSRLRIAFTIEELTDVWHHISDGRPVVSFGQFFEGTMALRTSGASLQATSIKKFRRCLLTHNGLGHSVDAMVRNIADMPAMRMVSEFLGDQHAQKQVAQDQAEAGVIREADLVYKEGVGFRHKAQIYEDPHVEDAVDSETSSTGNRSPTADDAAEAAALAARANPNARKNHKAGNKWHQAESVSPRSQRKITENHLQATKMAAKKLDAKQWIMQREETVTYTEMLAHGAKSGNLEAVRLALGCGADLSFSGAYGRTPLITAAMHGHADIVAELAAAPAALIDAVDFEKGWTALMYAGRWGMEQIVQLLLDCGADTEVAGNEGETMRDLAYDWGYDHIIGLVDRKLGLDVELPDGNDTALSAASLALLVSVQKGDVLGAMEALADGAEVDCVDSSGCTPLIIAINAGRSDIVAILLDEASLAFQGADVEATGPAGWTPFMYACRWGQIDTMVLLINNGADPGAQGDDGSTARELLREYEHEDLIDVMLLMKGVDIDVSSW